MTDLEINSRSTSQDCYLRLSYVVELVAAARKNLISHPEGSADVPLDTGSTTEAHVDIPCAGGCGSVDGEGRDHDSLAGAGEGAAGNKGAGDGDGEDNGVSRRQVGSGAGSSWITTLTAVPRVPVLGVTVLGPPPVGATVVK